MGIVKLNALGDYWKIDPVFHYHPIASRISRNRFLDIHRFLHFVNNRELPSYGEENYNKLQKVKTILTRLKQRYLDLFIPGQDQAIDEAMVKFKGQSSLKQYIPNKPIKRGFKMWMRADSKSGYVCEFEVYEGKKGDIVEKGLGAQVVMALTKHIHERYHHVYCDNFFTGVDSFWIF